MRASIKSLLLNALFLSTFLITSFPYSKYFFYPVIFLSFIFTLYYIKFDLKILLNHVKSFLLIIIQLFLFLLAFIQTSTIYPGLYKEGINFLCVVLIGFVLISLTDNIKDLRGVYIDFIRVAIYLPLLISIIGIVKFVLELYGIYLPIYYDSMYPFGSSLLPDYNYFSLISLTGIIFIIYNIFEEKIKLSNLFQQFALFCLSTSVLLTASRRANIILFVIIGFLVLFVILNQEHSLNIYFHNIRSKLSKLLLYYLAPFILVHSTIVLSLIFTNPESKVSISKSINLRLSKCQYYSTSIVNKLQSIIVPKDYINTFSKLWHGSFDSRFPQSGWGNGDYTLVHNLDSLGLQEVPNDAIGIRLDKNTNSYFGGLNSFYYSSYKQHYLNRDYRYVFNIFCYTSTDFDGNQINISAEMSDSNQKYAFYNHDKKGTWQKLSISLYGDNNLTNFYLSFYNDSVTNFSSLKGYVIFAYPSIDSIQISPNEPRSWATLDYREIYPLEGKNVNIVPEGSKGCLLDSSTYASIMTTSSYKYAYSYITYGDSMVNKGDKVLSDVYCYVANDFNGNIVMLMTKNGAQNSAYDLSNRGKWQKLSLSIDGDDAKLIVIMYFAKYGVTDYSSLKGFVIFAHPTFRIIHSDSLRFNELFSTKLIYPSSVSASILTLNRLFNQTVDGEINKTESAIITNSVDFNQKYSENNFAGPRFDHWRFGWHIFKSQNNLRQKIFGGGFDYLSQFGEEFHGDYRRLDWPHNPFVSVLLYAGITGLIAYLWLLLKTVHLYWRYRKEYWPLFICFAISFFFSFFSANNPLDPIIMGFYIILPFFIHNIHKKDLTLSANNNK